LGHLPSSSIIVVVVFLFCFIPGFFLFHEFYQRVPLLPTELPLFPDIIIIIIFITSRTMAF